MKTGEKNQHFCKTKGNDPTSDPVLFLQPPYGKIAAELLKSFPSMQCGTYAMGRFKDGEISLKIHTQVKGRGCLILGTLEPPDQNLIELSILAHTLKKEGAKKVTGFFPYLSYMRQDHDNPDTSLTTKWLADILESSGFDEIITIDIHSPLALSYFDIPVISISSAPFFAPELDQRDLEKTTLIAPDHGAIERCLDLQRALKRTIPVAYFEGEGNIKLNGKLSEKAVVFDDILDTGETLTLVCKYLHANKVADIIILVTHGLFHGNLWEDLWEYNVSEIYTTDTIPRTEHLAIKGISVLSIVPFLKALIGNYLK